MKQSFLRSTPCETAAFRIHCWLGKERTAFLRQTTPSEHWREFSKKHKCDLVNPPRIPSQIAHLPLHGYELTKRKRNGKSHHITAQASDKSLKVTVEQANCSVNQKYYPLGPLSSDRVAPWRLKEHFIVSKRLKFLSKQTPAHPKRHSVVPIHAEPTSDDTASYMEDWGKVNEERHFQIDRVIRYLAD